MIIFILLLISLVLWSPTVLLLFPFNLNIVTFLLHIFVIFFLYFKHKRRFSKILLFLSLSYFCCVTFSILINNNPTYITRTIWFITSLMIINFISKKEINKFIDIYSQFVLILLITSLIGFIYALLGGKPIFIIDYRSYNHLYLYFTTFTNSVSGNVIRVAGIYDEPGAFTFIIWINIILRDQYKKNEKLTLLILFLSNLTLSLIGIIFTIFYIFYKYIFINKNKKLLKISTLAFLLLLLYNYLESEPEFNFLFELFNYDPGKGLLVGDNRTPEVDNFLKYLIRKFYYLVKVHFHFIEGQ